jgi:hypothetical protein
LRAASKKLLRLGITLTTAHGGTKRLAGLATAFNEFRKIGPEKYTEALNILLDAWDGAFDSLRAESISAICEFVDLYEGEYDRKRLIRRFRGYDPINIFRKVRAMATISRIQNICIMYGNVQRNHRKISPFTLNSKEATMTEMRKNWFTACDIYIANLTLESSDKEARGRFWSFE